MLIDPASYRWHDQAWQGLALAGQVIYELHVGAFILANAGYWVREFHVDGACA